MFFVDGHKIGRTISDESRRMCPSRVSKEHIKTGLKELGLKKGDIVGVHNALSSFGYVARAQDK